METFSLTEGQDRTDFSRIMLPGYVGRVDSEEGQTGRPIRAAAEGLWR